VVCLVSNVNADFFPEMKARLGADILNRTFE